MKKLIITLALLAGMLVFGPQLPAEEGPGKGFEASMIQPLCHCSGPYCIVGESEIEIVSPRNETTIDYIILKWISGDGDGTADSVVAIYLETESNMGYILDDDMSVDDATMFLIQIRDDWGISWEDLYQHCPDWGI